MYVTNLSRLSAPPDTPSTGAGPGVAEVAFPAPQKSLDVEAVRAEAHRCLPLLAVESGLNASSEQSAAYWALKAIVASRLGRMDEARAAAAECERKAPEETVSIGYKYSPTLAALWLNELGKSPELRTLSVTDQFIEEKLFESAFDRKWGGVSHAIRVVLHDAVEAGDWQKLISLCESRPKDFLQSSIEKLVHEGRIDEANALNAVCCAIPAWETCSALKLVRLDVEAVVSEPRGAGPALKSHQWTTWEFETFREKFRGATGLSPEALFNFIVQREDVLSQRPLLGLAIELHGPDVVFGFARQSGSPVTTAIVLECIGRTEGYAKAAACRELLYQDNPSWAGRLFERAFNRIAGDRLLDSVRVGATDHALAKGRLDEARQHVGKVSARSMHRSDLLLEVAEKGAYSSSTLREIKAIARTLREPSEKIEFLGKAAKELGRQGDRVGVQECERLISRNVGRPKYDALLEQTIPIAQCDVAAGYAYLGNKTKASEICLSVLAKVQTGAGGPFDKARLMAVSILGRDGHPEDFASRGDDIAHVERHYNPSVVESFFDPRSDLPFARLELQKLRGLSFGGKIISTAWLQKALKGDLRAGDLGASIGVHFLYHTLEVLSASNSLRPATDQTLCDAAVNPNELDPRLRRELVPLLCSVAPRMVDDFLTKSPADEKEALGMLADLARFRAVRTPEERAGLAEQAGRSFERLIRMRPPQREAVQVACLIIKEASNPKATEVLLKAAQDPHTLGPHRARALEALADCDSIRAGRAAYEGALDPSVDRRAATLIMIKLARRGYLEPNLEKWMRSYDGEAGQQTSNPNHSRHTAAAGVIREIGRAGIVPSTEVLDFLVKERWTDDQGKTLETLEEKLQRVRQRLAEVESIEHPRELIAKLAADRSLALAYYIDQNPKTTFHWVGQYSFAQFFEIVTIASGLKLHAGPLDDMQAALERAGHPPADAKAIRTNLEAGRQPFYVAGNEERLGMPIRLDVSNAGRLAEANAEVGSAFGKDQLGLLLKAPLYRTYLARIDDRHAPKLAIALEQAETLSERQAVIESIESAYGNFKDRVRGDLAKPWAKFVRELDIEVSVDEVLEGPTPAVDCAEFLSATVKRRTDLQATYKQSLQALKGENPELKAIDDQLRKKRSSLAKMTQALEHNQALAPKVAVIEKDVAGLIARRQDLDSAKVVDRYSHLDTAAREAAVARETLELARLMEKDPHSILMCLAVGIIDDGLLTERDAALAKEVASHIEGAMKVTQAILALDQKGMRTKEQKECYLVLLDKRKDLMTLARFADSKVCCFSSSNYQMVVAHSVPNKEWVARALGDPCTYVFGVEENDPESPGVRKNLGFVLGWYGESVLIDGEQPHFGTVLNGVYLGSGNDSTSVSAVLNGIEDLLTVPLKGSFQFSASLHGGKIGSVPDGYETGSITIRRYRALADANGEPETKVYDDVGKAINVEIATTGIVKILSRQSGNTAS